MMRSELTTRVTKWSTLTLAIALTSCDRSTTTDPVVEQPAASVVGTLAARAIALALAEAPVRRLILNDLRDSPFSEHKVVLQDYLSTASGDELLAAMKRAGVDAEALRTTVQDAPRIQFYVPITEQRVAWRGTADVLVASGLGRDAADVGFAPSGSAQPLPSRERLAKDFGAVFVLQWAEPMFRRWSGPTAATETIQLANESQVGGGRVEYDGTGRVIRMIDNTPEGGRALYLTSPPDQSVPAGTYVDHVANQGVCDNGWIICDDLELQIIATSANGNYTSEELTGIGTPNSTWQGWWMIHTVRATPSIPVEVFLYENDGTSGNDVFFCAPHPQPNPCSQENNRPLLTGLDGVYSLCEDFDCPDGTLLLTFRDHADPVVTTVTVSPASQTVYNGQSVAYSTTPKDQYEDVMSGKVATWTSLNTSVATVASTGNLTATATGVGGGQATISATVDGVSGNSTLTVIAVTTVTVSPSSAEMCPGNNVAFTATVRDQNGNLWTSGTVVWSSSNTSVATTTSTGSRTASVQTVANGQVTVTATLEGVSGQSAIQVGPCLPPPTNCTLEYIPTPKYLKVSWVNGDPTASTEVWILQSGGSWQLVGTASPGVTQHFRVVGPGLYYARVRHVKSGYMASNYCDTNSKTVP